MILKYYKKREFWPAQGVIILEHNLTNILDTHKKFQMNCPAILSITWDVTVNWFNSYKVLCNYQELIVKQKQLTEEPEWSTWFNKLSVI